MKLLCAATIVESNKSEIKNNLFILVFSQNYSFFWKNDKLKEAVLYDAKYLQKVQFNKIACFFISEFSNPKKLYKFVLL